MRQPSLARALCILSFAVVLAPGQLVAQDSAETDRTITAVPLRGGAAAARAALAETGSPDASSLLLDVIRRSFQTPVGTKGLRRDAAVRPLLEYLDRQQNNPPAPPRGGTVPLPLTPAFWTATIFGGRSTPDTLIRDLVRSPVASLVYCALLSLDPPTREW